MRGHFTESEILRVLIERLEKMAKVDEKKRQEIAKDISHFCSSEVPDYSSDFYEGMKPELKELIAAFAALKTIPEGAYLVGDRIFDLQEINLALKRLRYLKTSAKR